MSDDALPGAPLGWAALLFTLLFALIGADLAMDYGAGVSPAHVVTEFSLMVLSAIGAFVLWRRWWSARETARLLARDVAAARAEAEHWRTEARDALGRMGAEIARQFERWGLTDAERRVALLLLEGLGHKQIAARRTTSERTVRQQAHTIYRKAGLSGRSELAAFFLEGLLLPEE